MLYLLLSLAMIEGASAALLTAPEIVERMVRADNERLAALSGYTGMRRYRFENKKLKKRAEMIVRVTRDSAGAKTFNVVAESGSGFVRKRIIRKMIEAEEEASRKTESASTRIMPANYDFRLLGTDDVDGRRSYVLEISPKTENKFLIRGRIWVDADEFAIVRIEGQPAKNPSFWVRGVQVVHRYSREGGFWLPLLNESRAQAKIFGPTEVAIEYFEYVTRVRDVQVRREPGEERL